MPSIRMAEKGDLPRVVELNMLSLNEMLEGGSLFYPPEIDLVRENVHKYWLQAPCFILEANNEIVGFAGLTLSRFYSGSKAIVQDYMFYILPEYRSLANLNLLCTHCKGFAKEAKLPLLLNFIVTDDTPLRERLFKINGFKIKSLMGGYFE